MHLGLAIEFGRHADLALLLIGLGLLYVASRAAVDALVTKNDPSPGWRAVGHHIPIAAVAVAGLCMREPMLSIGALFGASVASLSLGCGSVAVTAEHRIDALPGWRRTWPFVIVVAMLGMLAGLSGTLTLADAGIFLVEGVALWLLWGEQNNPKEGRRAIRPVLLTLSIVLAGVGAWAASRGAVEMSRAAQSVTIGTVAATMLGPMLVLPMLGSGAAMTARGAGGAAVTSQVGVVLLSLCFWLPVVIGVTYAQASAHKNLSSIQSATRPATTPAIAPATVPTTEPSPDLDSGSDILPQPTLVFPVVVWRVDTVVLLVLGLILLPAAIGRWPLERRDGLIMLLIYVAYLMVSAAAGRR